MKKPKRKSPYTVLLEEIKSHLFNVKHRHVVSMFLYPKDRLNQPGGWSLTDLYERTAAAEQLGYDVILNATDKGLLVSYVKKIPDPPVIWGFDI